MVSVVEYHVPIAYQYDTTVDANISDLTGVSRIKLLFSSLLTCSSEGNHPCVSHTKRNRELCSTLFEIFSSSARIFISGAF